MSAYLPRAVGTAVLQLEGDLTGGQTAIDSARDIILCWLREEAGHDLPESAVRGEAFSLSPDQGGVSAESLSENDPPVWALQVVIPDKTMPGRNWVVETALFQAALNRRLCVRLSCAARGDIGFFIPAVPRFMPELANRMGLESAGEPIRSAPIFATDKEDIENLVSLLEDSQRKLPVIVVSEAPREYPTRWLVNINSLARHLTGLAWVYNISYDAARMLTDSLGRTWSAYNGACRIYMPGFDRCSQSPYDHSLLLGERLLNTTWGEPWLRRTASIASIENTETYLRFPRFVTLRSQFASARFKRLKPDLTDKQQLAEVSAENDRLKEQILTWSQLTQIAESEKKIAHNDVKELKQTNASLRAYIETLEATRQTGVELGGPRPRSYSEIPQWVESTFGSRLVLSKKAQAAVMSSVYQDLELVCNALEMLAMHYVNMRRDGGSRPIYDERLRNLTLRDEQIGANLNKLRSDAQYICRFEGRDQFTDRHIKKGNSRDPREILRIYFCWDEESRQVIVGHLTSHLESEIS